jgi:hypothetical protein
MFCFCGSITSLQDIEGPFFIVSSTYIVPVVSSFWYRKRKCTTDAWRFKTNHLSFLFGDELGDLANGNSLTLITEGESAEGGVFGKGLDTDTGAVVAGDLQAGDDAHTLGGEARSLL